MNELSTKSMKTLRLASIIGIVCIHSTIQYLYGWMAWTLALELIALSILFTVCQFVIVLSKEIKVRIEVKPLASIIGIVCIQFTIQYLYGGMAWTLSAGIMALSMLFTACQFGIMLYEGIEVKIEVKPED